MTPVLRRDAGGLDRSRLGGGQGHCEVVSVVVSSLVAWTVPGWVDTGVAWSDGRVGCCGDSQKVHG